jgi:hygromycin-B 4-O-kinase
MSQLKPNVSLAEVNDVLHRFWGKKAQDIVAAEGGNMSSVYFFAVDGKRYVIRFSSLENAFDREQEIAVLLTSQEIPYPKIGGIGKAGDFTYCVSERAEGIVFADLQPERKAALLPEIIHIIAKMNQIELGETTGYGPMIARYNGEFASWEQFVTSFYGEDQSGTFWENWHELFHSTCLERDVFEEIYSRMIAYSAYNAPHRHFVHNDCHPWNIISDGYSITAIIDAGFLYGDFMIDIASFEDAVPGEDVAEAFRVYYEDTGRAIVNFEERLLGARYFKGLDALRFYAKMGWNDAYEQLRDKLLLLPKGSI